MRRIPEHLGLPDLATQPRSGARFNLLPAGGAITGGSTWYFQFWFRDG